MFAWGNRSDKENCNSMQIAKSMQHARIGNVITLPIPKSHEQFAVQPLGLVVQRLQIFVLHEVQKQTNLPEKTILSVHNMNPFALIIVFRLIHVARCELWIWILQVVMALAYQNLFFFNVTQCTFSSDFTSSEDISQWDPVPLSGINSLGIINSKLHCYIDTVDGRTSAPPDMYKTL